MFATVLLCTLIALGSGCSIYKIEISQGDRNLLQKVKGVEVGDTREQVREALGDPHVSDRFQPDQWHYYSIVRKGGQLISQESVEVIFDANGHVTELNILTSQGP